MDRMNLHSWIGIGAAHKANKGKPTHISIFFGALFAALAIAAMVFLFVR
jgi:hypothetical protein